MNKTVCAVVVTYNRKELLLECLKSLKKQTKPLDAIYLIDNASTDSTPQTLKEKGYINEIPPEDLQNPWEETVIIKNLIDKNNLKLHYVRMHKNTGGAGGFHEGIKRAYEKGYDWLWLMDDDTLPTKDSLKTLFDKLKLLNTHKEIGFVYSKVLWNNEVHLMNIPLVPQLMHGIPFNNYDDKGLILVKHASFVSCLISKCAIKDVGLPLKEFFIWGEDTEYTDRITENNYLGLYVKESIVHHNTPHNDNIDIYSAKSKDIWKYNYGIRNFLYIQKKKNFISFLYILAFNLVYVNLKIIQSRDNEKLKFIWTNTKSSLMSILFNPKIKKVKNEYINE